MVRAIGFVSIALLLAGCSRLATEAPTPRANIKQTGMAVANDQTGRRFFNVSGQVAGEQLAQARFGVNGKAAGVEAPATISVDPDRRIIYTASLQLVVKDLKAATDAMPRLIAENKGYLAESSVTGAQGGYPSARWVARIPTDRFPAFLDAASQLGTPISRSQQGQDVTEEFMDLEARISNARKLEARLLTFATEKAGEVKDLLAVEKELSRVRGEIEQMEGRLKYLANRTAFSTVTIDAHEEKDYVPPRAPTFVDRAGRTWGDSIESLVDFGQNATLAGIALTPWIPVLAVAAFPVFWFARRFRRRRGAKPAHPTATGT